MNSNEVWKWEMYRLVGEYDQRPGLPAPLVVVELLYKVLKSIWKKTCRRKKENCKYNRNIIIFESNAGTFIPGLKPFIII